MAAGAARRRSAPPGPATGRGRGCAASAPWPGTAPTGQRRAPPRCCATASRTSARTDQFRLCRPYPVRVTRLRLHRVHFSTYDARVEDSLERLDAEIVACRTCVRLVAWREQVGREKRAAFTDSDYWAQPVT